MLKMKTRCQACASALSDSGGAYICSYECTFCEPCAVRLAYCCPNCAGNLVQRPLRARKPARVLVDRLFKRGVRT
ncbi:MULTISPECIES: DUF1272 domain-containing protein [Pseudomonas]|uniref:DUF1272 domain-containing protein n=1 Tax=Pseudomonas piscis TaxID=2614538 RepID=U6ZNU6_9PSED|nr:MULTISPECIES: DUF1272 domain-containing protein [Pseudomonas]AZC18586.1 hypothetical protein C4K40_3198 [Pseudomonas sp. CMR5c]ERO59951.1 hypothetical protein P308_16155 [Pseudomonas piscis]MCU7646601.1 DUF1272 domain-containing protein [Pseudomonas piscis]MQA54208.1 DUF1272 domain-containing protein [Pseudomonas piscis]